MLSTLVHNQPVDKGSQSVLFVPTVVYTSQKHSVRKLDLSGGC